MIRILSLSMFFVLNFGTVTIEHQRHQIVKQNPESGWQKVEIDKLRRRPQHPIRDVQIQTLVENRVFAILCLIREWLRGRNAGHDANRAEGHLIQGDFPKDDL